LTSELPQLHGLHVLSWDRGDVLTVPAAAMRTVLAAARSGSDLVVVDLPRRLDEATALALQACAVVLVVVPGEVRAVASAGRVVAAVREHAGDLRCVVRAPAASGLDGRTVAEALGLPLDGWLAAEPGLAAALDRGEPPGRRVRGPLARFSDGFLADVVAAGAAA
jgi:secretion/DNA translocation related CpaE-like protein